MNNLRYVQDKKEIAITATARMKQAVTNTETPGRK